MKYLNIVWGNLDKITPIDQAYRGQKLIMHSALHIFEKCGHMPQLERAEEFYDLVLDFLEA
jgi:pimeloyl-ACP methyl ester carboxylesterase